MHLADPASPAVASRLFAATILATMAGVFLGIFFLFVDTDLAARIAVVLLVGVVGVLSWLRHTVYYRSDQARMGWKQEHPQFQMEVGLSEPGDRSGRGGGGRPLLGVARLCDLILHLRPLPLRGAGNPRLRVPGQPVFEGEKERPEQCLLCCCPGRVQRISSLYPIQHESST